MIVDKKHSKCESYQTWTDLGTEYGCGYEHPDICCEDCIYGRHGGTLDPETKEKLDDR